jgi:hypothetical protein
MKKYFIIIATLFITVAAIAQDSLQKKQVQLHSIEELKLLSVLW